MEATHIYRITWLGKMSGFRMTATYRNITEDQLNKLITDKLEKNIKPIKIRKMQKVSA